MRCIESRRPTCCAAVRLGQARLRLRDPATAHDLAQRPVLRVIEIDDDERAALMMTSNAAARTRLKDRITAPVTRKNGSRASSAWSSKSPRNSATTS